MLGEGIGAEQCDYESLCGQALRLEQARGSKRGWYFHGKLYNLTTNILFLICIITELGWVKTRPIALARKERGRAPQQGQARGPHATANCPTLTI